MEEEEQGDEGITWTLVKQLNGPSGGYRVRVKWVKKLLRLNGETRFSRLASLIIRRTARRPSNASCLPPVINLNSKSDPPLRPNESQFATSNRTDIVITTVITFRSRLAIVIVILFPDIE